jgi:hypothetical protein
MRGAASHGELGFAVHRRSHCHAWSIVGPVVDVDEQYPVRMLALRGAQQAQRRCGGQVDRLAWMHRHRAPGHHDDRPIRAQQPLHPRRQLGHLIPHCRR